jgi:hypothetical protein
MNFQEDMITKIQDAIRDDKMQQITTYLLELRFIEEQYSNRIINDREMILASSEKLFEVVKILEDLKTISPSEKIDEPNKLPLLLDLDYRLNQLMHEVNRYVDRFSHLMSLLPPASEPPVDR